MKPPAFDYLVADSVDSAIAELDRGGDDAKLLAGGQSLLPLLNFRLARPSLLIDVNRIPRLADITVEADVVRIGALTRHRQLETSRTIAGHLPLLTEAAGWIAHPQIRTRGTIGGSVSHADASAELPVVLTALNASAVVVSTLGSRTMPVSEVAVAHYVNSLAHDEMIVEIRVPRLPEHTGTAFTEFARRHGDYAIGGAASIVTLDAEGVCTAARIVALGGGQTPAVCAAAAQALVGTTLTGHDIESAAQAARPDLHPMATAHGSTDYRRDVIVAMIERSATTAAARARSAK